MKIKLSKNKKIILLISGLGILTTSIVTPILVINNKNKDNKQSIVDSNKDNKQSIVDSNTKQNSKDLKKVNEIIAKIKDKDILIPSNVSTQNQSEIQNAIKDQLKKENQTLNQNDLSKITTNIKSLTLGNQIEVTLTIDVRRKIKKLKINVEKINLLKNSNIHNGYFATIFQDSFKNLWAMSLGIRLQVLKANDSKNGYVSQGWTDNTNQGLLNGSNIINGSDGRIFQDKFKNLWTMANKKLQVLKVNSGGTGYVPTGWTDDITKGLLKDSNIIFGNNGTIFQDSFGNLWAMGGDNKKLQVLRVNSVGDGYTSEGWTDNTNQGLLNGSNIDDGRDGAIFQDSFKNLWAMGKGQKLQVLKANDSKNGYVSQGWTDNTNQGLLNGSNIINGWYGTIFQDKFKNLWAMANKKLQVLKVNSVGDGYTSEGWTDNTNQELLNGSNVIDGQYGTIFQDKFKNLWAMANNSQLQVLRVNSVGDGYTSEGWTDNTNQGLLNGSNIISGGVGIIFQDKFKNLWAMANKKLQVLKVNLGGTGYVSTGWTNDITQGLLKNSNMKNDSTGKIFQDSFGNLWAIGNETSLQVLIANSNNTGYINSWL